MDDSEHRLRDPHGTVGVTDSVVMRVREFKNHALKDFFEFWV
jgi:hypothetical protein